MKIGRLLTTLFMISTVISLSVASTSIVGAESYTYDDAGRLTSVTYDDESSISYSYDAAGNRLQASTAGTASDPTPDIKVNNSDGPITIGQESDLAISISLTPGANEGGSADWWLVADTCEGWYFYNIAGNWINGLATSYQGSLFNLPSVETLGANSLPECAHTFYFGVDMIMNSSLDLDQLYYDSVLTTKH